MFSCITIKLVIHLNSNFHHAKINKQGRRNNAHFMEA